jgi:hypothetical protein
VTKAELALAWASVGAGEIRGARAAAMELYLVRARFVRLPCAAKAAAVQRRLGEKITAGGSYPAGRGIASLVQGAGAAYLR